jgi:AAA domain-containing protein
MQLIDLTIQNVRRFAKRLTLKFHPAYNVILAYNETGKSTLIDTVMSAIDGKYQNGLAQPMVSWDPAKDPNGNVFCGAVLRFKNREGGAYTLQRDFSSGNIVLSSYMEMVKKFEKVADDEESFQKIFFENVRFPEPDVYRRVFITTAEDLPSSGGTGTVAASSGVAGSMMGGVDDGPEMSSSDLEAKLEILKEQLELYEDLENLQFKIDGIQRQLDDLTLEMESVAKIDEEIAEVDEVIQREIGAKDINAQVEEKIRDYKNIKNEQIHEVGDLEGHRLDKKAEVDKERFKTPFFKTPMFLGGVAITLTFFIVPIVINKGSLAVIGFAGLALVGVSVFKGLQQAGNATKKKEELKEIEEKISDTENRFGAVINLVDALMRNNQVNDPADLLDKVKEYRKASDKKAGLDEQRAKRSKEIDYDSAAKRKIDLQHEIDDGNAKMEKYAGVTMDATEIKREMKQVEASLGIGAEDSGTDAGMDFTSSTATGKVAAGVDYETLINDGLALSGMDPDEYIGKINTKFLFYLAGVTAKKYTVGKVDMSGSIFVTGGPGNREFAIDDLSPATQDAVFFALKFALYEITSSNSPAPVFFDDPFIKFDDQRLSAIASALKYLGKYCQMVHLTSRQLHVKLADQSVSINKI